MVLRKSPRVGLDLYVSKSLFATLVEIADSKLLFSVLDNLCVKEQVFMISLS